jgi:hypothetical protein
MAMVELTSSPVAALVRGVLVVGCERQESGDVRLYLGARYRNEYAVFPAGDDADRAENAWNATHHTHLWLVERDVSDALAAPGGE